MAGEAAMKKRGPKEIGEFVLMSPAGDPIMRANLSIKPVPTDRAKEDMQLKGFVAVPSSMATIGPGGSVQFVPAPAPVKREPAFVSAAATSAPMVFSATKGGAVSPGEIPSASYSLYYTPQPVDMQKVEALNAMLEQAFIGVSVAAGLGFEPSDWKAMKEAYDASRRADGSIDYAKFGSALPGELRGKLDKFYKLLGNIMELLGDSVVGRVALSSFVAKDRANADSAIKWLDENAAVFSYALAEVLYADKGEGERMAGAKAMYARLMEMRGMLSSERSRMRGSAQNFVPVMGRGVATFGLSEGKLAVAYVPSDKFALTATPAGLVANITGRSMGGAVGYSRDAGLQAAVGGAFAVGEFSVSSGYRYTERDKSTLTVATGTQF